MKKFILFALFSFISVSTILAKDLVLTFNPEYCDRSTAAPTDKNATLYFQVKIDDFCWDVTNFWHNADQNAVICGREKESTLGPNNKKAYIKMEQNTIKNEVSEIIITVDKVNPDEIQSITVSRGYGADSPDETITKSVAEIVPGDLHFVFDTRQADCYYTITFEFYPQIANNEVLQISKVVYKDANPTTDPDPEPEPETDALTLNLSKVVMNTSDSFSQTIKATSDDMNWTLENFCNSDGTLRCGGNTEQTSASITTDFPLPDHLKEIALTLDKVDTDKVGDISLLAFGENNLTHPIEIVKAQPAEGEVIIPVTPQPGLKYRIAFDCHTPDANGTIAISKIVYRYNTDITAAETASLFISETDSEDASFTEHSSNAYQSNDSWIVVKFGVPEGHSLWHRFVSNGSIVAPVDATPTKIAPRSDASDDTRCNFTQFDETPFKHIDNGALEFYTENTDGTRSALRSVEFSGVTAIDDDIIVDNNAPAEVYNLRGVKIEKITEPGVYILHQHGNSKKIVVKSLR